MSLITKKHIVLVSETYLPLVGGAEMYTYNFLKQLTSQGYTATVITHSEGNIPEQFIIPSVTILCIPKANKANIFGVLRNMLIIWRNTNTVDFVCANYTYSLSTLAAIICFVRRRKLLVFAHGLGTIIDITHPRIYYVYRYISLSLAYRVVTTSEEIADIVKKYTRHVIVATAVDFTTLDLQYNQATVQAIQTQYPGKKIIVTIRRLVEKNGIQFLIEMIPYLTKHRKDIIFLIIGDGRLRLILEQRVQQLNIEEYVIFVGVKNNDEVFNYIKSASVVIFPSSAEALSLAAIEVMHAQVPIVVSTIGGLRELIGADETRGTGMDIFGRYESIYTPPDPTYISEETYAKCANIIDSTLDSNPEIAQKIATAKEYVDTTFDWKLVVKDILAFLG